MMKITHEQELAELRAEFANVDTSDPASVLEWFAKHSYLTTSEHAMVAQLSASGLQRLRRKACLIKSPPKTMPKPPYGRRVIHDIQIPADWNNKEWLTAAVYKHGIKPTSVALGIHFSKLYELMEEHDIARPPRKTNRSTNPCCTKEWCFEHYITQRLSQDGCAKLANIDETTFRQWLIKFSIPIRNSKNLRHPIWVTKLIQNLERQDIVRWVEMNPRHVHVRYKSFMWDNYYIDEVGWRTKRRKHSFRIHRHNAVITKVPTIETQFEGSLDNINEFAAHIHLPRKAFQSATFIEQRLALQELLRVLCRRGWVWPKYPERIIANELALLRESRLTQFYREGRYTAYPNRGQQPTLGQRIVAHFFGLEELAPIFKSPRKMIQILDAMFLGGRDFTLDWIIRHVCSDIPGTPKVFDPGVYHWVLHQLGAKGTVLDLHPGNGHKAIACALAGLRYTTVPSPHFQAAIDNGFAEFLKLGYEPYTGQKVDWVLSDSDFRGTEIAEALSCESKHLLHFVPRAQHKAHLRYKPSMIIPIVTRHTNRLPNYLFVF